MSNPGDKVAHSPWLDPGRIQQTLTRLVSINSVNPAHGGPPDGEWRAIEAVAEILAEAGIETTQYEAAPGRPNLRARLAGRRRRPCLLLETHLDTVTTRDMTIDPFSGKVEQGRLWGRGATDAKAQAACMIHALAAWATGGEPPPCDIELALVVDEEVGFAGAEALVREAPEVDGIVIGEPTGLRIVTTHKGVLRWWITLIGKAAHSARPALGVNAIAAAAAFICEVQEFYLPLLARRRTPLLEPPTLNTAIIEGGSQTNLVPERCRLALERRLLPGEGPTEIQREMDELFQRARNRFPDFHAVAEPYTLEAPPMFTDPESHLALMAREVAADLGHPAEPMGVDYGTDACRLQALGLPIIIAGPGSIDQAHTADESIRLNDLTAGARLYAELIARANRLEVAG